MKNLLLVMVTLVFSLTSFSQEKNSSGVILENNTLKCVGKLDGNVFSYDMVTVYNGKEIRLRSIGGDKLTDEMIGVINDLPKYFNEGDTTQVVFMNIVMTSGKNTKDRIKLPPVIEEIIF